MSKNVSKIVGKVDAIKWVKENKGYPAIGTFGDQKSLQKFYKQLPIETLEDWAKVEKLEYKPCVEQPAIHRMRVAMAILYKHFPKEAPKGKKKSKYADYTTEALVQLACDQGVPVEVTEDMRIMRMRTIMALRAAKVID